MKKIICLCLIMCLISVSFMLPVYVEAGSDSSLECGGCVLPDDGEESYTPPQKYQWGRFIYRISNEGSYREGVEVIWFDPDNSNVGGVIDPEASNAYETEFDGNLVIPETIDGRIVTSVNYSPWYYGSVPEGIITMTIPKTANSIDWTSLGGLLELTDIHVDSENKEFCSQDGVLFNKDMTRLLAYPRGRKGSYIMPDTVLSVASAFDDCTGLTSIDLSDNLEVIGVDDFRDCTSLTEINIPESVKQIYAMAFRCCTSLAKINIHKNITWLGYDAFYNTAFYNDEKNWENGILYLDYILVEAKAGVTNVTVKEGTRVVAQNAFTKSWGTLTDVTLPFGIKVLNDNAFDVSSLERINLPNSIVEMGNYVFRRCDNVENLVLPESLERIGSYVLPKKFYQATPDEQGIVYHGRFLVCGNPDVAKGCITIKNGTKYILQHAFNNCGAIDELVIPQSVQFVGIEALGGIKYIHVPSTMNLSGWTHQHGKISFVGDKNSSVYAQLLEFKTTYNQFMYITERDDSTICINEYNSFADQYKGTSIKIPLELNGKKVTALGKNFLSNYANSGYFYVYISPNVKELDYSAFKKFDNMNIRGYIGSYAESFAKEHNIPFTAMIPGGDLTGDYEVKADDALCALQASIEKLELTETQIPKADTDGNREITSADALSILQKAVNMIEFLPNEIFNS